MMRDLIFLTSNAQIAANSIENNTNNTNNKQKQSIYKLSTYKTKLKNKRL